MLSDDEINKLKNRIQGLLLSKRRTLDLVEDRLPILFEALTFFSLAKRYKKKGCNIRFKKLVKKKFRYKNTPKGNPHDYSYIEIIRSQLEIYELRPNLRVFGHDLPEIPITPDCSVIKSRSLKKNSSIKYLGIVLDNSNLITFVEAKKINGFPTLISSFRGLVEDLCPNFILEPEKIQFQNEDIHPYPILALSGRLSNNACLQYEAYRKKGWKILICPHIIEDENNLIGLSYNNVDNLKMKYNILT